MNEDFNVSCWIWTQEGVNEKITEPQIVYFRKIFQHSTQIKISANCRYKLFINDVFVQEGPQKGNKEFAYVDTANIASYLKSGENVAAVEVLYYPEDASCRNDSLYYSPTPALYIEDLSDDDELSGKYGWKYHYAEHIKIVREDFDPAPICGSEIVHGSKMLQGWKLPAYDDSLWKLARPYTFLESTKAIAPFNMENRTIPLMAHEKMHFSEVICMRDDDGALKTENQVHAEHNIKVQWENLLLHDMPVIISAHTKQIVELGAGVLMCGYPELHMLDGKNARIKIIYAECYSKPQENLKTPFGERKAPTLKSDRTDYVHGNLEGTQDIYDVCGCGTKQAPEIYVPFLFRTFRYIRFEITAADEDLVILNYSYLSTGYPLNVQTHLKTSDESLNKIWDMSLRTLKRCMHETYIDCPFYEQLQYAMDSRAEILFTYNVAADDRLARQCMDAFRKTQRLDGILQASAPAESVNVIPGFSIFYILMVHDHMMYFGDKALVKDHFACIDAILRFFDRHLTKKGLVGSVGGVLFQHKYWSFIDWCDEWNDTIGVPTAAVMGDESITMESLLYLYGLNAAAELAAYIGRNNTTDEYLQRADALKNAILKYCTGKDGLIQDGPGLELYSTHAQVWAILNDLVDEAQGRKNLEKTYGVKNIPQCSVSMSFYLFLALKKIHWMEKADDVWHIWRKMLEEHLTTCVENTTDQRSDCHAWGSVILYVLPAVYLGIQPTKPGFESYEKDIQLGHLQWIHGEVITPKGLIRI